MNASGALLVVAIVSACESRNRAKPTPGGESAGAASSPADHAPLRPALEAAPAPASPPTGERIGFDWGPPCRVPAMQDVDNDGTRARIAFDVVLERTGGRLVAKLDNMRAVATPGSSLGKAALDEVLSWFDGMIPPIAVAANGESEGALDIDRAIEAIMKRIPTNNAQGAATMQKMLRSPQWRAAFEQKATETWDAWVGSFTELDIAPNTVRRDTIDLPSALGTFEDVKITVTHHGAVREAPALSLISIEQTIEGPELGQILVGAMKDFMPASVGAPPTFKHAKKTDTVTVAIDPKLGRPHRARHVMAIEIENRSKRKTRDTAFDWSRATGCVAAPKTAGSAQTGRNP